MTSPAEILWILSGLLPVFVYVLGCTVVTGEIKEATGSHAVIGQAVFSLGAA